MLIYCKVRKTLKTVNAIKTLYDVKGLDTVFIESDNVRVYFINFSATLEICELDNALLLKKFCKKYVFTANNADDLFDMFGGLAFKKFIRSCRNGSYREDNQLQKYNVQYEEIDVPAETVFSPFKNAEKQNLYAPNISNTEMAKAIIAGQIEQITHKKKNVNMLEFACECFNKNYGFWCYIEEINHLRAGWFDHVVCDVYLK